MLRMIEKQEIIIRYFRQGHSQRKISRDLGLHRHTVRKYIEEYESDRQDLSKSELRADVSDAIMHPPRYDSSGRKKRKLTEQITQEIDEYMKQNTIKRSSGRGKQVMKKIDVYEALQAKGYDISYPSVCNYMRSRSWKREVYIRQVYSPGSVCEFDWGEVKLEINGVLRTYQLAVFTLAWSNYRFAKLYSRQHQQSFQQSHVCFFEHIAGVPVQMVYDNMRVAVKRFVGRNEKEATQGLLGMSMYYQFAFRFCNIGKGNEKGHVERSVEYIRRKAFCRVDSFDNLEQANAHLAGIVKGLNAKQQREKKASALELLLQARSYLGVCPAHPMECAELVTAKVDKYSTVCLYQNYYSVPELLVGKVVQIKVYAQHLLIYYNNACIWRHERHYTSFGWYLELNHYLDTLKRKPGALKSSQALEQAHTDLKYIYRTYFVEQPRQFIELLHYQRAKAWSTLHIQQAIQSLIRMGCRSISLDKIKVCLENAPVQEQLPKEGQIEKLAKAQLAQLSTLFHQN